MLSSQIKRYKPASV